MSQTVTLGDQQVTIQDFNSLKFLEAMGLIGEIMEIVPKADEEIAKYTQQWLAQNGTENVLDRASARYLFGANPKLETITEADWEASGQKLRLAKSPDNSAAIMRAFPAVYKHARPQVENLLCLLATPNSKLEDADNAGELDKLYVTGGAVHETRKLVLHRAKLSQQVSLVIACVRQLVEEFQEADLAGQMGELRKAVMDLQGALGGESNAESDTPDDDEPDEKADTSPEPSSSMPSSPVTPASPEPTSSTASRTGS